MSEAETTNPVAEEELVSTEAPEVEAEAPEPELDDDGNPVEPEPEDDSEELEYEGKTFKGPKGLKDAILRQADYTRKTQEIAETRKALEARQAEIAQQAEAQAMTLTERVQLAQIDASLQQYEGADWTKYGQDHGPGAVATAMAHWRQLEAARGQLNTTISDKEAEYRLSSERITASALQEADQILRAEFKDFGPEKFSGAVKAATSIGFTPEEIRESFVGSDGKADVRTIKALIELADLRAFKAQHESKTTKAATAEKLAKVTPAVTVAAKAGGYKPGLDDSLPLDEWTRRRNAAVAKQRGG